MKWRNAATSDLPEPVGVARMTFLPGDQLEERLLLRGVELEAPVGDVGEEALEEIVGEELAVDRRQARGEGRGSDHRRREPDTESRRAVSPAPSPGVGAGRYLASSLARM